MSTSTIYGFILDDSTSKGSRIDLTAEFDKDYGTLVGEPANYLVNKGYIRDIRDTRLAILIEFLKVFLMVIISLYLIRVDSSTLLIDFYSRTL